MKILLIDADSKIPNLALMKLSTYHKKVGDSVSLFRVGLVGYPKKKSIRIIDAYGYDKVYCSIVFTTNKDYIVIDGCDDIVFGGSGYDFLINLPEQIDNLLPDYSIYPDNKIAVGFITRGCIRNCSFCFVPKKEGKLKFYCDWRNVVVDGFHHTEFLDNNFLAWEDHIKVLKELVDDKIYCAFNQGLDIRLLNDENMELLSRLRYFGEYIFAFDDVRYEKIVSRGLNIFRRYVSSNWRAKMFIYCSPKMNIKEDVLYRINWCKENKVLPYLMRDFSCYVDDKRGLYNDLAAWCNQPGLFKNMDLDMFINKRHTNKTKSGLVLDMLRNN